MFTDLLNWLLFFVVTLPIVGWIAQRIGVRKLRDAYAVAGLALGFYFLRDLYLRVQEEGILIVSVLPPPIGACLEIDALGVFMAFVALVLGVLVAIYSVRYMERDTGLTMYYTLFLAMIAGMIGTYFAGDFFTLFMFWEMMCIASYVLVAFRKERWAPIEAGFKYLIMSSFGSASLLFAMSLLYGSAGTLNFAYLADSLRGTSSAWLYAIMAMIVIGFGVKSAIVPMHTWLPDAHPEAPSSISALLSGILIQTGLYGLCRVLSLLFDISLYGLLIAAFAALTMTVGNFMALLQDDVKRLLAYSSIAQIGYMLIGLATGTVLGLMGTFAHVFNHALMKGLAFLCAGVIVYRIEERDITRLEGVGRAMPITFVALTISVLGLAGMPTTSGFISKFILFTSTFEVDMAWLGVLGVLNSAFSVAYYLRIVKTLITRPKEPVKVREGPALMSVVLIVMTFLIIFFGIWPQPILELAERASVSLISFEEYVKPIVSR